MIGKWNANVESQEITWSYRQVWPLVEYGVGQKLTVFPPEGTGHSKHPLPTIVDFIHGHHQMVSKYQNQIDYILCN